MSKEGYYKHYKYTNPRELKWAKVLAGDLSNEEAFGQPEKQFAELASDNVNGNGFDDENFKLESIGSYPPNSLQGQRQMQNAGFGDYANNKKKYELGEPLIAEKHMRPPKPIEPIDIESFGQKKGGVASLSDYKDSEKQKQQSGRDYRYMQSPIMPQNHSDQDGFSTALGAIGTAANFAAPIVPYAGLAAGIVAIGKGLYDRKKAFDNAKKEDRRRRIQERNINDYDHEMQGMRKFR